MKVLMLRAGAKREADLSLAQGWRTKTDISTRVGTWQMRAMATGGLKLQGLSLEKRTALGVAPGKMALEVAMLGSSGPFGAAKKAGFRQGDVLVEVDGVSTEVTESELLGRLLTAYTPKTNLKTSVLRGTERVELLLPIQ
jgi:S1-C subfamily serine protease